MTQVRLSTSAVLSHGGTVSGEPDAVARAVEIDRGMVAAEREWVAELRERGVKAAHPDDGWVDRDENRVHLCYPQFNDNPGVGDLIALGWPWGTTRIVRITGHENMRFAMPDQQPWWLCFEEVERS